MLVFLPQLTICLLLTEYKASKVYPDLIMKYSRKEQTSNMNFLYISIYLCAYQFIAQTL